MLIFFFLLQTIDLSGYTARMATGEDIRDQRKKDSAFEIVGPGKKTHTVCIMQKARRRIRYEIDMYILYIYMHMCGLTL